MDNMYVASKFLAAVTLPHHKISGDILILEAADEKEQEQLVLDLVRATLGNALRLSNGVMVIVK
jgi:hypothetical protein